MAIDGDMVIHVGPATPKDVIPLEEIEAFRIPKGTFVSLRPGVWHGGPFTTTDKPVSVLIVLPERTYANDCEGHKLDEKDYIEIEGI